jgi:hypothetical protein
MYNIITLCRKCSKGISGFFWGIIEKTQYHFLVWHFAKVINVPFCEVIFGIVLMRIYEYWVIALSIKKHRNKYF